MTLSTKTARVMAHRILARDVHEIVLQPEQPGGEPFRAGQYILVQTGSTSARPFSIASSPGCPSRFSLCIRRYREGTATPVLTSLEPGQEVRYEGPTGEFLLDPMDRARLFIATGTGISPLRSMILEHLESGDDRPAWLIFGNRSREDCIYHEQFRELEAAYRQFRYEPCLSRPTGSGWDGETGRVTGLIPRCLDDARPWTAYICGRDEMIADVTLLLGELGVPRSRCHREP